MTKLSRNMSFNASLQGGRLVEATRADKSEFSANKAFLARASKIGQPTSSQTTPAPPKPRR